MSNDQNKETNKLVEARELTDKELKGVVGGTTDNGKVMVANFPPSIAILLTAVGLLAESL